MSDYPTALMPYLVVRGAADALRFYAEAFGAEEVFRLVDPADGRIGHAEIRLGGALFMLADEYPDFGALSPDTIGGSPVKLHLYVEDADTAFRRALAAGATEIRPVKDQFFGDRSGQLADPFGHVWTLAARTEIVSPEEMQARWNRAMEG